MNEKPLHQSFPNKSFLVSGSLLAGLAVILGAFGAHALKEKLSADQLRIFHTAVEYQFYHSLALLATGILADKFTSALLKTAGWLFITGILLFSGSLYLLSLVESLKWMGAITPFGGLSFILGWMLLAAGIYRQK